MNTRSSVLRRSRRRANSSSSMTSFRQRGAKGVARARPQQPLQLPALAQIFQATERGDDLLAHRPVLATVLDNLEIGATAGGLLSEKHGEEPRRRLIRGPHKIGWSAIKVNNNLSLRGTTLSPKRHPGVNHINDLRPALGSKLSKISSTSPTESQTSRLSGYREARPNV